MTIDNELITSFKEKSVRGCGRKHTLLFLNYFHSPTKTVFFISVPKQKNHLSFSNFAVLPI